MSEKKVARNAPCPCGSGKKYKMCCLLREQAGTGDNLWQKLRQVDESIVQQLFKFTAKKFGEEAIYEGWDVFVTYDEETPFDFDSPQNQVFFPWFLFNWRPEDLEKVNDDEVIVHEYPSIAEAFLTKNRKTLSEMERRFIEISCATEFSFHEVLECRPGAGFTLRDILLEHEVNVTEQSASQSVREGDVLFAKVIEYDHVGLMIGCAPAVIPPGYKPTIIELRALLREDRGAVDESLLAERSNEIRNVYFDLYEAMHTPPELFNTDGDPISMHEMTFEIRSAGVAFEKLKSLDLNSTGDELLEEAEFDGDGTLQHVAFCWTARGKSASALSDSTILGHLAIEGTKLTALVNSAKRAAKLRKEIRKRLGDEIKFYVTEVKSVEEMIAESKGIPEENPVTEMPAELQAEIDRRMAAHWDQWINDKIPALGGLTPRQAVKDKDGREKLIALLTDFERKESRPHGGINQLKYIQQTRKRLGLE